MSPYYETLTDQEKQKWLRLYHQILNVTTPHYSHPDYDHVLSDGGAYRDKVLCPMVYALTDWAYKREL